MDRCADCPGRGGIFAAIGEGVPVRDGERNVVSAEGGSRSVDATTRPRAAIGLAGSGWRGACGRHRIQPRGWDIHLREKPPSATVPRYPRAHAARYGGAVQFRGRGTSATWPGRTTGVLVGATRGADGRALSPPSPLPRLDRGLSAYGNAGAPGRSS